ncbi:MAG: electron transport complex subunit E [Planctomycetota bacterium]|nr:MAG: electron transport complex subunit E [Planctomycetota bacterium]
MKVGAVIREGIWERNPVFVLFLGLCPVLAVTTSLKNGVGMACAATAVLICTNTIISAMRKIIPAEIRIPCFIVIIATFVTLVDLVMKAYTPALNEALGIFIPLIVVNCIILGRAEAFASKNSPGMAVGDAIGIGLGFLIALVIVSGVREILGAGQIWGVNIFPQAFYDKVFAPIGVMVQAPGAFLALGCLLALFAHMDNRRVRCEREEAALPWVDTMDEILRKVPEKKKKKKEE